MLVHGSVMPPRSVVEALDAVVRSVRPPRAEAEQGSGKGLLRRLGRHRAEEEQADDPAAALEHVPVERMLFPITGFGNLTANDANRVADAIREAAAGWDVPTVRFSGGTALDFPGDWSVWAKLAGDVDGAMTVARGVTESVQRLGFFVDRRQFRPMMSVGTVTAETTGPYLEALVAALEQFEGEEWTPTISLTKETFIGGRPELTEFVRIAVGS